MRSILLAALAALAVLTFVTPAAADELDDILEAGRIRIGVCLTWEPAGFRDNEGVPHGYDVDIANLVADDLNVSLELVETSSATRMADLINGRIDILACNITATTERAKLVDFSFPYLRTGLRLLVLKNSTIAGFADMTASTRVVVIRDTTGDRLVQRLAPTAQRIFVESPGDAALLLRQGAADAYVEDSLAVDYIGKSFPDQMRVLPDIYTVDAISFGVRKGNPSLLRWLDLFASLYVSSGTYAETYGKWWGGPPPPLDPVW